MDEAFEEMWDSAASSDRPAVRRAIVRGRPWNRDNSLAASVNRYLPANYRVDHTIDQGDEDRIPSVMVVGEDVAGWTLDGYVLPRLASGMYYGEEVTE